MSRSTIHISVPEAVKRYVDTRVGESGYGSVSEYFRNLIRDDRQRQLNRMQSIRRVATTSVPQFRPLAAAARKQK